MRRAITLILPLGAFLIGLCLDQVRADPPNKPIASFATAKRIARDVIYVDRHEELYCGCGFVPNEKGSGGKIRNIECGYRPRKSAKRGKQLEWEHIMPAAVFGRERTCWSDGHRLCTDGNGKAFAGRRCCAKVDKKFKAIEADLHNLAPAVGELNGDRGDKPYGIISENLKQYGRCEFQVDFGNDLAEPRRSIRGFVARVWFYMSKTYGVELDDETKDLLKSWSERDPVDSKERERDRRIAGEQGNHNPFVKNATP